MSHNKSKWRRSPVQPDLSFILTESAKLFLDSYALPALLYPERVFLSNQLYKSTIESLQKVWIQNSDYISALICKTKVEI